MNRKDFDQPAHEVAVSVWVGKRGIDAVVDELEGQLADGGPVKVKFLRPARTEESVETMAEALANRTDARIVDQRGHTAVLQRE